MAAAMTNKFFNSYSKWVKLSDAIQRSDKAGMEALRKAADAGEPVWRYCDPYQDYTLLHKAACFEDRLGCIQLLLELEEANAEERLLLNKRDIYGRTALSEACFWACACGRSFDHTCIKQLIDAGANWNIPDNAGTLPFTKLSPEEYDQVYSIFTFTEENDDSRVTRAEVEAYVKERYSQLRGVSEGEEPVYQQEL